MKRFLKRDGKKTGFPPGTLVHIGDIKPANTTISVIEYSEEHFVEKSLNSVDELQPCRRDKAFTWIAVTGVNDISLIKGLGDRFNLHSLLQEDIMNTTQRPKVESWDSHLYIVLRLLTAEQDFEEIHSEQISLILGSNYLISLTERDTGVFDPVVERLIAGKGKIRKSGSDYLAYVLIDTVVDQYFLLLELLGEKMERLEIELLSRPTDSTLQVIHKLKREILFVRKSIWPLRDLVNNLLRDDSSLIKDTTTIYLRDVHDHTIQIMDSVESFRDMLSGMLDIYLSSISNRMNEVMKVLTLIATIFIPLTFIAGIYGMNFELMPELKWPWGYPVALLAMAIVGVGMAIYFKRKKWL